MKLVLGNFNLSEVIEEIIKLMSIQANLKSIRIFPPTKLSKDLIIFSDKRRIK